MPVMPTQVLMRATPALDTPHGDKPMTWNSGMHEDDAIAQEMKKWSKK